jgi:hypothetical protein
VRVDSLTRRAVDNWCDSKAKLYAVAVARACCGTALYIQEDVGFQVVAMETAVPDGFEKADPRPRRDSGTLNDAFGVE